MGWNYPYISLNDMMKLIKGFVDMMVLASGYRSSGLVAHWDSHNISKLLQWGLFFENVLRSLNSSDVCRPSVEELDAALSEMTSHPSFPQGLAHLSSATLDKARGFVSEHLIHALPLRDTHLRAFLTAAIEMELNELSEREHDCLNAYLSKLMPQNNSLNSVSERRSFVMDLDFPLPNITPKINGKCSREYLTELTVQELFKRQSAVLCIRTLETSLDILSNTIRCMESESESDNNGLSTKLLKHDKSSALMGSEQLIDFFTWNHWKSRILSYFLDKRTVQLVSGASMIFSAPKIQWIQVFERLQVSKERIDDLHEVIELILLGCIVSRWSCLIEHLMSIAYDSSSISKQYQELCKLILGRSPSFDLKEGIINSKESCILEYLIGLLGGRLHQLWKLPPALAAVAIPSWSPLFKLYLNEIETQFKGNSSTMRCCNCTQDRKEHKDCELAERTWCLYIFHVSGSHLMNGASCT
ncbi:FANCF domain-containing protein [Cephalotus follicularis]|uniref:FANCF domain-containing protein n=1 Tax=Cephalotus follicularis TaxID=3775 RepID=A0A1Q3C0L6_CEPFO|nr:FANCF domain-containing protein [Cephalotus follicularis]